MAIETGIERAIMLADFGELVTFTPFGGSSVSITGIFDSTYEAVDSGGSVSFAVEQPRLTVKTSDVSGVAEGDLFTIRSSSYIARVIMADGTGITEIALEAQ